MTREQYLQMRRQGHIGNIIYNYYLKGCDTRKFKILGTDEFMHIFNMYPGKQQAVENVLREWDIKYDVRTLTNAEGRVLMYL